MAHADPALAEAAALVRDALRSAWAQRLSPAAWAAALRAAVRARYGEGAAGAMALSADVIGGALLAQAVTGAPPSQLLLDYLRHALSVGLLPPADLVRLLADRSSTDAAWAAHAAPLLPVVADCVRHIQPPRGRWLQYLAELAAASHAAAEGAVSRQDGGGEDGAELATAEAVLHAVRFAAAVLSATEGAGASAAADALRVWAAVLGDLRLSALLRVASAAHPDDWLAVAAQLQEGVAAAVAAGALPADRAGDVTRLLAAVDADGRAERAWRQAVHQLNEEGLRGSPRPSLAVAALLQRQVERLLVRVDSAVDLLEPIRDAQCMDRQQLVEALYVAALQGLAHASLAATKPAPAAAGDPRGPRPDLTMPWLALLLSRLPYWIAELNRRERMHRARSGASVAVLTELAQQQTADVRTVVDQLATFAPLVRTCDYALDTAGVTLPTVSAVRISLVAAAVLPPDGLDAAELAELERLSQEAAELAAAPLDAVWAACLQPLVLQNVATAQLLAAVEAAATGASADALDVATLGAICRQLLQSPFLLDVLNVHVRLHAFLLPLERAVNAVEAYATAHRELASTAVVWTDFNAVLFLLHALLERFDLYFQPATVFADEAGFCQRYFSGANCASPVLSRHDDPSADPDADLLGMMLQELLMQEPPAPALSSQPPFELVRLAKAVAVQAALAAQLDSPPTAVTEDRLLDIFLAWAATPAMAAALPMALSALADDWAVGSSCWARKDDPLAAAVPAADPAAAAATAAANPMLPLPLRVVATVLRGTAAPQGLLQAVGPAILRALHMGPHSAAVGELAHWLRRALGAGSSVVVDAAGDWRGLVPVPAPYRRPADAATGMAAVGGGAVQEGHAGASTAALAGPWTAQESAFRREFHYAVAGIEAQRAAVPPLMLSRATGPPDVDRSAGPVRLRVLGRYMALMGPNDFCASAIEAMLVEADNGRGMRAADLVAMLMAVPPPPDTSGAFSPLALIAMAVGEIIMPTIHRCSSAARASALGALFVRLSLLLPVLVRDGVDGAVGAEPSGKWRAAWEQAEQALPPAAAHGPRPEKPSVPPPPAVTLFDLMGAQLGMQFDMLWAVVEDKPDIVLSFLTATYGHPAACRLGLPRSSTVVRRLHALGRADIIPRLYNLDDARDRAALARVLAFPLPPELAVSPIGDAPEPVH